MTNVNSLGQLKNLDNVVGGGLIVAVDGPSGTGKSTVCRLLAGAADARYLDTGAMYRVATLHVLRQGTDPADTAAVVAATADLPIRVNEDPASTEVLLDGEDVSSEIRGPQVTAAVSAVAAVPEVRENLVALQRSLALGTGRCVVEGRDIGTAVLPDAACKVFMTASARIRARRRFDQDRAAGRRVDFDAVLADVERRDAADSSRAVSPLRPAADATILDTGDLDIDGVLHALADLVVASSAHPADFTISGSNR
ncbi:Cytidylate kinase [Corynebacterium provencense]|uniref:Cytidylate kinase n=1 Tax=Corynebacterium provencense TaxID=1737425 RepID=A0A2Z3YQ60_9CORY|nr:Cytidylate kinase [Corynebacterium provencense]